MARKPKNISGELDEPADAAIEEAAPVETEAAITTAHQPEVIEDTAIEEAAPVETEAAITPAHQPEVIEDTVLQAHVIRQETYFVETAPTVAKQAREDAEREALLQQQEIIAERNRKEREEQAARQRNIDERETAAVRIAALMREIDELNSSIKEKTAEVESLEQLVKE